MTYEKLCNGPARRPIRAGAQAIAHLVAVILEIISQLLHSHIAVARLHAVTYSRGHRVAAGGRGEGGGETGSREEKEQSRGRENSQKNDGQNEACSVAPHASRRHVRLPILVIHRGNPAAEREQRRAKHEDTCSCREEIGRMHARRRVRHAVSAGVDLESSHVPYMPSSTHWFVLAMQAPSAPCSHMRTAQ